MGSARHHHYNLIFILLEWGLLECIGSAGLHQSNHIIQQLVPKTIKKKLNYMIMNILNATYDHNYQPFSEVYSDMAFQIIKTQNFISSLKTINQVYKD